MSEVLDRFYPAKKDLFSLLDKNYSAIGVAEFFHSKIEIVNSGMFCKIIDGVCFIVKSSHQMGKYSLILYTHPVGLKSKDIFEEFKNNSIQIRNSQIRGLIDGWKEEYIYCADEYNLLIGSKFRDHRNILKNIDLYEVKEGINKDVETIVKNWSGLKQESHQERLFKTIIKNKEYCRVLTTYLRGIPIGFSVVETINERNAIIIQRLINPIDIIKEVKEVNYILHWFDCQTNPGKLLNMGAVGNNKNLALAKEKLRPITKQMIYRQKAYLKTTKNHYDRFNANRRIQLDLY